MHDDIAYLSPSVAKILVEQTPYDAWLSHYRLGGKDRPRDEASTPAKDFGKAVDRLVFGVGPELILRQPREKAESDWQRLYLTQTVYDQAKACAESVLCSFKPANDNAQVQPKQIWQSSGGVWCKAKPDYYDANTGDIVDLKTAYDLSDKAIERAIQSFGYDIQAAAYLEAASELYPEKPHSFRFLFVKSKPNYNCRWVKLDSRALGNGTAKWLQAVAKWKDCLATDTWPGYSDLVAGCPPWAMIETENDTEEQ